MGKRCNLHWSKHKKNKNFARNSKTWMPVLPLVTTLQVILFLCPDGVVWYSALTGVLSCSGKMHSEDRRSRSWSHLAVTMKKKDEDKASMCTKLSDMRTRKSQRNTARVWTKLPCTLSYRWTFSVAQFSCSVVSNSFRPHGLQHARLPCPSPTPQAYSNSCPLHQWCQ